VRRALICCTVLISGAIALSQYRLWRRSQQPPKLVLWAWERPEDLSFIDSSEISVAYLAGTIRLHGGAVEAVPRLQPLRVPPNTRVSAAVRIESAASASTRLTPVQREQTVSAIVWMTNRPGTVGTQIDFDARPPERAFYGDLLRDLRRRLPAGVPLSITALASWCMEDDWIAGLPIDEAVPMLFRMGPGDAEVRRRLRRGQDFTDPACRFSAGVSTDEPLPRLHYGRRVYIFHPRAWTAAAAANILREVRSWQ
jgi:hypothetical protein